MTISAIILKIILEIFFLRQVLLITVKLLLMFLVLVSATLASDRSTSSKIRD